MSKVYFSVDGKWLVGRSIESCHRRDIAAWLHAEQGKMHWGKDDSKSRLVLVRLLADQHGEQEFAEWIINRNLEG